MIDINGPIIFKDIFQSFGFTEAELDEYLFYNEDNIIWLYSPLIIRKENESIVSGWSYILNEGVINSSQIYIYGENKINSNTFSPFIMNQSLKNKYNEVEQIISANANMFPDEIFKVNLEAVLKKYSVEVIIQENDYRIRIRPFLIQEITYDLFYNDLDEKLKFNIFNPDL